MTLEKTTQEDDFNWNDIIADFLLTIDVASKSDLETLLIEV